MIPDDWTGLPAEAVLDLGFSTHSPGFSAEGLVYRADGTAVKALNPRNTWLPVTATDLLERPLDDTTSHEVTDGTARLRLRPFQILTLRLRPRATGGTSAD